MFSIDVDLQVVKATNPEMKQYEERFDKELRRMLINAKSYRTPKVQLNRFKSKRMVTFTNF